MEVLENHIARRRAIHVLDTGLLNGITGIVVQQNPSAEFDSNFWLTCITIDPAQAGVTADEIHVYLDGEQIESRLLWRPMHMQPVFADAPFYGDGTSERIFGKGLCLPSGSSLTDAQIVRVADKIKEFIACKR